jgi:hypothetical protein
LVSFFVHTELLRNVLLTPLLTLPFTVFTQISDYVVLNKARQKALSISLSTAKVNRGRVPKKAYIPLKNIVDANTHTSQKKT